MIDVHRLRTLNEDIEKFTIEVCEGLSPAATADLLEAETVFKEKLADAILLTTKQDQAE